MEFLLIARKGKVIKENNGNRSHPRFIRIITRRPPVLPSSLRNDLGARRKIWRKEIDGFYFGNQLHIWDLFR